MGPQRSYDEIDIELHSHQHGLQPSPSPKHKYKHSHSAIYPDHSSGIEDDETSSNDGIDFLRIWIQRETQLRDTAEVRAVCRKLQTACMMRERWVYQDKNGHFPCCLVRDQDVCLNINIVKNALPQKSNHCFEL